MSGSGIINHPLRDEPGLKTKIFNHHSSEYSSPATHVRQGSWGNVCVTRCMCEYSREHVHTTRRHPVLGKGTDFSSIITQNFLVKFPLVSRKFWASKFPRLGEFEPKFPEEILGEEILPENFLVRNGFFPPRNF